MEKKKEKTVSNSYKNFNFDIQENSTMYLFTI